VVSHGRDHNEAEREEGRKGSSSRVGDEPPPKWAGVVITGVFMVVGVALAAVGVGLMPADPPAGAFVTGAGVLLFFVAGEGVSRTLGSARPDWWPEHFLNLEGVR
jgi:hypothetical protein